MTILPRASAVALLSILCLVGVFTDLAQTKTQEDEPETKAQAALTFAIVPQQSASRLAREWGPLIAALSEETGLPMRFVTTKDIPTFEACLDNGVFDIAYMNPYHYVVFSEAGKYSAIAHQADKRLKGLMVVRAESDISDIAQLEGGVIAFPSPGAFGASVLPRAELQQREIGFEPRYVRSHDSVYRAVAGGFAVAGGGVARTLNAAPEELREQLRVIYTTEGYTPHAIATRAGLAESDAARVRDALATLAEDGSETVFPLGISSFVAAQDAEWDDIRALGLKPEQAGLDQLDEGACPFD